MSKKDLNYVAKVEKAIAEKYGNEAIENPKNSWTPEKEKQYIEQVKMLQSKLASLEQKIEKIEYSGFLVSKRLLNKASNRSCPVCKIYSFDMKDDVYMHKFECCFKCYIQHVEDREERWNSGWRPGEKNEQ